MDEDVAACHKAGGEAIFSETQLYVHEADFNNDSIIDYVIDHAGLFCKGSAKVSGGAGGYRVMVLMSTVEGRYIRVATLQSPSTKVVPQDGKDLLNVGGTLYGWNGQSFDKVK